VANSGVIDWTPGLVDGHVQACVKGCVLEIHPTSDGYFGTIDGKARGKRRYASVESAKRWTVRRALGMTKRATSQQVSENP
jgi:hypothetical protein